MKFEMLAFIALVLAAIPCGLFLVNLAFYRRTKHFSLSPGFSQVTTGHADLENRLSGFQFGVDATTGLKPGAIESFGLCGVSVLIPARNEEANMRDTLNTVLANHGADFEVIVLDDHSTDRTAEIAREFAANDSRVRLENAPPLPAGWCGKQHACHVLAQRAKNPLLVFMDADVRLMPDALVRMTAFMGNDEARMTNDETRIGRASFSSFIIHHSSLPMLASGVPRQELGTFSERLLIPLIHFVLLGYLPMFMMRWTNRAAFSAGCGQLFVARADAYRATGGHARIRATLHDGVKLPRLFRAAGFKTDLFDATDIASCRMYRTNGEVWHGLGKNATEGLAARETILPMTGLLLGGQVLPFALLLGAAGMTARALVLTLVAATLAYLPRLIAIGKFRQSFGTALLHPLGVVALVVIQWLALARQFRGKPAEWKGRSYAANVAQPVEAA